MHTIMYIYEHRIVWGVVPTQHSSSMCLFRDGTLNKLKNFSQMLYD